MFICTYETKQFFEFDDRRGYLRNLVNNCEWEGEKNKSSTRFEPVTSAISVHRSYKL